MGENISEMGSWPQEKWREGAVLERFLVQTKSGDEFVNYRYCNSADEVNQAVKESGRETKVLFQSNPDEWVDEVGLLEKKKNP